LQTHTHTENIKEIFALLYRIIFGYKINVIKKKNHIIEQLTNTDKWQIDSIMMRNKLYILHRYIVHETCINSVNCLIAKKIFFINTTDFFGYLRFRICYIVISQVFS